MMIRNKQLSLAMLFALMVIVTAHAQENTPFDTMKIDTNLVVLRIAVSDHGLIVALDAKLPTYRTRLASSGF